ncbi:hypothetical protein [Nocardiopsis metallicus]|uniref:Uncharacterized protein n=1 Tax=Nocardiopsis metallicus TaxID=179819 RepID=A0A840WT11_9ACTN|nr:hypothetical protein [Nocardiopsis metallicus]MBB5494697.1 hypothetical protein [Nocardiopsis metallicus]
MGTPHPSYDDSYVDVDTRLSAFLTKHPEGALQPLDPARPYRVERVEGTDERGRSVVTTFLVYTAAAYRSPDDQLPGVGVAWTPFPGRTDYTLDAELQNAETAAWGRAIRAVMPIDRASSARRSPAQGKPLPERQVQGLRTRANKSATPDLLKVLVAEIDDFQAQGRLHKETADELRKLAQDRQEHLAASTASNDGKKTPLSVVETPGEKPTPTADEDLKTRAKRISAKYGTPPASSKTKKNEGEASE